MGFKCGIVGLPNVGKTTIFNALSGLSAVVAKYPFTTIEPNTALVPVPDERLHAIARLLRPEKVTPSAIEFVDVAGLVAGASRGLGLGNQFLSYIRAVDAVVHVVRCFEDPDVAHLAGGVDPVRDVGIIGTELILSDLEIVDRRLNKLTRAVRVGLKEAGVELETFTKAREVLNRERPLRSLSWSPQEMELFREAGLLTAKPMLYVANTGEDGAESVLTPLMGLAQDESSPLIIISGKLEAEIAALPPGEQADFLREMGLGESGLKRLIRAGYQILDLISFFTIVGKEVRAWAIPRGTTAYGAAGKIHTDFQKGFVRVEVMTSSDFIRYGSEHKVREAGSIHIEGRDYQVKDGDILHFRFTP